MKVSFRYNARKVEVWNEDDVPVKVSVVRDREDTVMTVIILGPKSFTLWPTDVHGRIVLDDHPGSRYVLDEPWRIEVEAKNSP